LTLHQNKIKSILDKKVNDLVVRMVIYFLIFLESIRNYTWKFYEWMDFEFNGCLHSTWIYASFNLKV